MPVYPMGFSTTLKSKEISIVIDIIGELTSTYIQIPRYHSKQRILIPIMDSDDERADEPKEKDAAEKTERSSTNQSIT